MTTETTALAVVDNQPKVAVQWRQATDVAGAVRDFALKRVCTIQGKRYPPVEVWQAVANAFGYVGSAHSVEKVSGGIRAIGEVRRISDGAVVATGEGFVGDDEPTWSKRPEFARRAMAQTRAISRACRSAFAFVLPLIDANLQTTPAEEMDFIDGNAATAAPSRPAAGNGFAKPRPTVPAPQRASLESSLGFAPEPPPPSDADYVPSDSELSDAAQARNESFEPEATVPFGKHKGKRLSEVPTKDLQWLHDATAENVADPAKARFKAKNEADLRAMQRELERR